MRIRLTTLALLLFVVGSAMGATGDILGVSTTNNAGQAWFNSSANLTLYIDGMGTNGTYDTGLTNTTTAAYDTLNLAPAKLVVTLNSQGFDAKGNPTNYQRILYGTKNARMPYPNFTNANEVLFGGTLSVSFWLSDYIYSGDSNITVTVASGVYVQGGVTNHSYSGSVTNKSTLPYPNYMGQWTFPDRSRVVNTWTNRYLGAGKFAFNMRPLAFAYDVSSDAHGHVITNTPTLAIDRTSKGHPVIDYASVCYATNFAEGDLVTNNFYLFPWIGTNIVTSASLVHCIPQFQVCDFSNRWDAVAVMAPTSSGPGIATNSANLSVARSNPFTNLNDALTALKNYNLALLRTNASGAMIYCKAGTYAGQMAPTGTHSFDDSWVTVTHDSGLTQADVILTNSGPGFASPNTDFLKFQDVTLVQNNQWFSFLSVPSGLWLDNCFYSGYLNGNGAGGAEIFNSTPTNYVTDCVVSNNYYSGSWYGQVLRGSLFDDMWRVFAPPSYCINGNIFNSHTNEGSDFCDNMPDNAIFINNSFFNMARLGMTLDTGTYGAALLQSEFETTPGSSQPILQIAGSGGAPGTTNALVAKCTTVGDRVNIFYYQTEAAGPSWIQEATLKDNVISGMATKTDTFILATNQYGNWTFENGVGCAGNYIRQWTGAGGVGNDFGMEFCGLSSIVAFAPTSPNSFPVQYVLDGSSYGTGLGKGNYRLQSSSPVNQMSHCDWNGLPWDIEGVWRGAWDMPGAYSSANPRRGALLLEQ